MTTNVYHSSVNFIKFWCWSQKKRIRSWWQCTIFILWRPWKQEKCKNCWITIQFVLWKTTRWVIQYNTKSDGDQPREKCSYQQFENLLTLFGRMSYSNVVKVLSYQFKWTQLQIQLLSHLIATKKDSQKKRVKSTKKYLHGVVEFSFVTKIENRKSKTMLNHNCICSPNTIQS